MRNPLQDQLLKAGLVKKSRVAEIAREQAKQRHGKGLPTPSVEQVNAQQLQAERAERDRSLAAERNGRNHANELRAQVRQIVEANKIVREGEIAYRFNDEGTIKSVLVNEVLRRQLASGTLVIVRHDLGYELLSRSAAEKVHVRDAAAIVLDHGSRNAEVVAGEDEEHYQQFKVPDDLIW